MTMKYGVRDQNGNKVLAKLTEGSSLLSRSRAYMGPSDWSNYTVEGDVLATQKRRQQGDAGVIAQRYVLTLYGNSQMLHLEPWQPETAGRRACPSPGSPTPGTVSNYRSRICPDGKTRARGKAWPASEPEPPHG